MSTPHDVGTQIGTETAPAPAPARPAGRRQRKPSPESPAAPVEVAAPDAANADPALDPAAIAPSLEAILLSTDRAVPPARLLEVLAPDFPALSAAALRRIVEHLNADYERTHRAFRIEPVSGGLRIMTLPQHAEVLARFHGQRAHTRLSRAAIETLAIIAYKQPITRAELEAIRGVASGEILKTLMERRLVTITGRAEELGRPMLYGTTRQFLEVFGLASLKDLPPPEEFALKA